MRLGYEVRRMELHQIRYFIAAAEELSVTKAAQRMHVSQPALSRQIASLEDELGVALFDRIKKRIHLTEAGKFYLQRVRQIVCDVDTSAQLVQERFGKAQRTLRLGFMTPFIDDIVTPAVIALKKSAPRVQVSLQELSARAQLDRVRDRELDVALLGNVPAEDRELLGWRYVFRSRMAIVLPEDDPRSKRKQLSLKELAADSFVSLSDDTFPGRRLFLQSMCRGQGFEAEIATECDSIPLMIGCVAAGDGVGVLPQHCRKFPHHGVRFIPMKTPTVYADVIAIFRNEALGEDIAAVIAALEVAGEAVAEA